MKCTLLLLSALSCLTVPAPAQDQDRPVLGEAAGYSILYAGKPGSERESAFLAFLRQWFQKVDAVSLEDLNAPSMEAYDVVIADWGRRYKDGRYDSTSGHRTSGNLSTAKPMILIGAVGGELARGTKLDWL